MGEPVNSRSTRLCRAGGRKAGRGNRSVSARTGGCAVAGGRGWRSAVPAAACAGPVPDAAGRVRGRCAPLSRAESSCVKRDKSGWIKLCHKRDRAVFRAVSRFVSLLGEDRTGKATSRYSRGNADPVAAGGDARAGEASPGRRRGWTGRRDGIGCSWSATRFLAWLRQRRRPYGRAAGARSCSRRRWRPGADRRVGGDRPAAGRRRRHARRTGARRTGGDGVPVRAGPAALRGRRGRSLLGTGRTGRTAAVPPAGDAPGPVGRRAAGAARGGRPPPRRRAVPALDRLPRPPHRRHPRAAGGHRVRRPVRSGRLPARHGGVRRPAPAQRVGGHPHRPSRGPGPEGRRDLRRGGCRQPGPGAGAGRRPR